MKSIHQRLSTLRIEGKLIDLKDTGKQKKINFHTPTRCNGLYKWILTLIKGTG